jgi:hypothetical protein
LVKRAADTNSVRRNVTGSKPIDKLDDNLPPPGDKPGKYFNLPGRKEEGETKDSREVIKQLHTEEETKNNIAAAVPRKRRCPIVEVILFGLWKARSADIQWMVQAWNDGRGRTPRHTGRVFVCC